MLHKHFGEMELADYEVRRDAAGVAVDYVALSRVILGQGVDQRLAWQDVPGDELVFPIANHQGSTIALLDEDAEQLPADSGGRFTYDPFGQTVRGGTAGGYPYRYTGRRLDAQTGLYYYRARYYDPELGRFLQTDPIGYEDGPNWYIYVGNDPLNGTDPSGTSVLGGPMGWEIFFTSEKLRQECGTECAMEFFQSHGSIARGSGSYARGHYRNLKHIGRDTIGSFFSSDIKESTQLEKEIINRAWDLAKNDPGTQARLGKMIWDRVKADPGYAVGRLGAGAVVGGKLNGYLKNTVTGGAGISGVLSAFVANGDLREAVQQGLEDPVDLFEQAIFGNLSEEVEIPERRD